MSTRLVIDQKEGLKEEEKADLPPLPRSIKLSAKAISYIFHPVFVPVYMVIYMVWFHPYLFAGFFSFDKSRVVIMAIMMYCFFPLVTVLLLKALKFIDTVLLENQKDRIIPLIACGIWYFWVWYVWRNLPEYPATAVQLSLGIWISVSLALLANIRMKVSLHAISMGVLITFFFGLAYSQYVRVSGILSCAILITGLVCTSRFIVSNHTEKEVYTGLFIGVLSMLLGQQFG
jgi:hypothetical protein